MSGRGLRVCVIITCCNEGGLIAEAVRSVRESEPVDIVIVDDASDDGNTLDRLAQLERQGFRVLRQERNSGIASARMLGLASTSAPFVYPLDADDLAFPGVLARMADALERDPAAAACVGDVIEFGDRELVRKTPSDLDPYRLAYTNEYPITALFRRASIEAVGGWQKLGNNHGYDDWSLWLSLAEHGYRIIHIGGPGYGYCRRLHGTRLNHQARKHHRELYAEIQSRHAMLFARIKDHRRRSDLSRLKKLLYPHVHGTRTQVPLEQTLKPHFDRLGIWTRGQPLPRNVREQAVMSVLKAS